MAGERQSQYLIAVVVGDRNLGTFDKLSGGGMTSDEQKYRPGGMQPHRSLGGSQTVDNVTVSRLAADDDDLHWLMQGAGKLGMVVSRTKLDADGNAFGRPVVYSGRLQNVTPPEIDSESDDPALLELEMAPSGSVG